MAAPCPCCACDAVAGAAAHRLREALADDDLDGAITLGLLEDRIACPACSPECRAGLEAARQAGQRALAARERYRARGLRLARRERERAARRAPPGDAAPDGATPTATTALPPAAALALARAKARAAGRKP